MNYKDSRLTFGSMSCSEQLQRGSLQSKSFLFTLSSILKHPSNSLRFIYNVFWNIYFGTFSKHLCGLYREKRQVIAQNYSLFCINKQVETSTAMLFFLRGTGVCISRKEVLCLCIFVNGKTNNLNSSLLKRVFLLI